MRDMIGFTGFPRECHVFFRDLAKHNTTAWFSRHREEYEENVLVPSRLFVMEMGDRLSALAPDIIADPRANRSLFRINRDTRFSPNKTPYKTHIGILFWEGIGPRLECSGFYVHIEPESLFLGAGVYRFSATVLSAYREAVVDKRKGTALARAVEEVTAKGPYSIDGARYKRVPRGFDPNHPNAPLLLHDGLWVGLETPLPEELRSRAFLDYCFERFSQMAPVHRWLVELIELQ